MAGLFRRRVAPTPGVSGDDQCRFRMNVAGADASGLSDLAHAGSRGSMNGTSIPNSEVSPLSYWKARPMRSNCCIKKVAVVSTLRLPGPVQVLKHPLSLGPTIARQINAVSGLTIVEHPVSAVAVMGDDVVECEAGGWSIELSLAP